MKILLTLNHTFSSLHLREVIILFYFRFFLLYLSDTNGIFWQLNVCLVFTRPLIPPPYTASRVGNSLSNSRVSNSLINSRVNNNTIIIHFIETRLQKIKLAQ